MANFTGKQKKLMAAGSTAAVLVLALGIAAVTLGGGSHADVPPAASQSSQPDVAVSGIPQPEVTPPEVSVPTADNPGEETQSPDPVLNVEEENHGRGRVDKPGSAPGL